ncbi:MAG: flavodoxin-dependent (E)-4-hydroxy-3-methylbut-2-enyl-diphosphate synthase [Moorellales bacterium]
MRRPSLAVRVGTVTVGGGAPIVVQSMTKTDTRDPVATLKQIQELAEAGCELVRVAVPDREAVAALRTIKAHSPLPVIADIHFDHRLALAALEAGVDGLRLNPGNIGGPERVREVAREAAAREVPIRVGVNAGSLERELRHRYGGPTPEALVESALRHVRLLEDAGFNLIKISLKAAEVPVMVQAYRLLADKVPYPLHLGVTEAGPLLSGSVKSALGIGILLAEGIGDTIRVSLTADPCWEVKVAYDILRSLGLRQRGVEIISCPTCGRCRIDVDSLAQTVEKRLARVVEPLRVAVMGCEVNGPGEARQADLGVAGTRGGGVIFRRGEVVRRVSTEEIAEALAQEVALLLGHPV